MARPPRPSRLLPLLLVALLLIVHAQLWFGRGSVPQVAALAQKLEAQTQRNTEARQQNERLAAEVQDLQEGLDMVEEKARRELGMVKPNEIYVQIEQ
ncbi:septum formation initiator family protein [Hylemonella sp. W303a]|uniref:septum formation initiator family protein n=1 Tax=Hylemonella sp. W303a TaxID=3389873 RepID=UPI00396AF761